jgi:hypothetical protein
MQRATHIQQELNELNSTVANIPFVPTYTIPHQFFTTLPLYIIAKINSATTYTVPNSYFETLSTNILHKIKEEQDDLPVLFNDISKQNVYEVPSGYFEKNTITTKEDAKVIAMPKSSKTTWIKYAVAACIVGIISFTAINVATTYNNKTVSTDTIIKGTSLTYNQIQQINVEKALDSLTLNEVDNYLCLNGLVVCNDNKKEEDNFQKELESLNLSDEDLANVLEESN